MEVLDGEEFFPPCLYPLLFLEELALRAVPVPAGVVGYLCVPALLALVDVTPSSAVLQVSIACMVRSWFKGSLWVSRYEGPWMRKMSATSAGAMKDLLCVEGTSDVREALRAHVEVDDRRLE